MPEGTGEDEGGGKWPGQERDRLKAVHILELSFLEADNVGGLGNASQKYPHLSLSSRPRTFQDMMVTGLAALAMEEPAGHQGKQVGILGSTDRQGIAKEGADDGSAVFQR